MVSSADILAAFREVTNVKQIERSELYGLLQDGIMAALAKKYGPNVQAEVEIDDDRGGIKIVLLKTVVDTVDSVAAPVTERETEPVGEVVGQVVRPVVDTVAAPGGEMPDPVLEGLRWRRQVDVVGQRARGRPERRHVLAAALAAGEMRLVGLELGAVECVEGVGGGELVGRTVVHSASREGYHSAVRSSTAPG